MRKRKDPEKCHKVWVVSVPPDIDASVRSVMESNAWKRSHVVALAVRAGINEAERVIAASGVAGRPLVG